MAWIKNGTPHTLTSANSVLSISNLTAKKFNQFLFHDINPSNSTAHYLTFNNNTSLVYSRNTSGNGGAFVPDGGLNGIILGHTVASDSFHVSWFCDISGEEKLGITWQTERSTDNVATPPNRRKQVSKFLPSPMADITQVTYTLDGGATYDTNSNLTAIGTTGNEATSVTFSSETLPLSNSGVSTTGCKAYWKLDESSGTLVNYATTANGFADGLGTAADSSSTANLTYAQTGKVGSAVSFNGTTNSSKAVIGTSTSQFNFMHNTSALFTFNVWYKKSAIDSNFRTIIAEHFGGGVQNGFRAAFNGSLGMQTIILSGGNNVVLDTTTGFLPNNTDWNMLTLTYDQSLASNNLKVYSNGVLSHQVTKTGTTPSNGNSAFAMQMGDDAGGDGNMNGLLDEMSIFNRVLTQAEITKLYSQFKIQDYTRFEETDTQTIYYLADRATYETDFSSSSGWTLGTGATISGGTLNLVSGASSARNSYYDLGAGVVASTWVLRFKLALNNFDNTAAGQAQVLVFGIGSSATETGESPTADALLFHMDGLGAGSQVFFKARSWETSGYTATDGISRSEPLTVTRWIEVTHQNNNLRVRVYTDSTYTTLEETINLAITSSNYSGLRYIFARTYDQATSNTHIYVFDDVKFYNGVTTATTNKTWWAQQ